MDLQTLQYQMWLAVKKYQVLIGRRQEEPHNLSIQKEILDVLCQLVSINENQKLVVAKLREERGSKYQDYNDRDRNRIDVVSSDQFLKDIQHHEGRNPRLSPCLSHYINKSPQNLDHGILTSPYPDFSIERQQNDSLSLHASSEEPLDCSITGDMCGASEPNSPSWWCSPEKRLHNFQPPTADYSVEDVHDLVSEDEFMHALGLLTVGECEEVLAKRYERRKHSAYSHIFSSTIWEKPETRRKRRAWLTSGAGSPPNLRRKVQPLSQPPSRPESRPVSPAQSSCSPPTTYLPSHPTSPQSLDDYPLNSQSSEEVCPMCNVKGADIQCDGCGVVYHSHCVDLEDSYPPPCWLCLTCEQLGLRASSNTDPQHDSRRREVLEVREQLLRQRAELTVSKLQLEERKHHLAVALETQQLERRKLQIKEDEVRKAIHQLHNFIYTFQRPKSPNIFLPSPEEPQNTFYSAENSASSFSHHDTSDSALPYYSSSSNQSSPVSSEDLTSIKSLTSRHLYNCTSLPNQTEIPQASAQASSCSPGSSPGHISQTCVPNKIPSHSTSPNQMSNSSSEHQPVPQIFMSSHLKSSEPATYQTNPFSSHYKSGKSSLKKGTLHHENSLTVEGKYGSEGRKTKSNTIRIKHQSEAMNPQPKDLSTSAHSRQNFGLPRMRRGESKSMTASI